jgi:hypothetical protein
MLKHHCQWEVFCDPEIGIPVVRVVFLEVGKHVVLPKAQTKLGPSCTGHGEHWMGTLVEGVFLERFAAEAYLKGCWQGQLLAVVWYTCFLIPRLTTQLVLCCSLLQNPQGFCSST